MPSETMTPKTEQRLRALVRESADDLAAARALIDAARVACAVQYARAEALTAKVAEVQQERDAARAALVRVVRGCRYDCTRESHCSQCARALAGLPEEYPL